MQQFSLNVDQPAAVCQCKLFRSAVAGMLLPPLGRILVAQNEALKYKQAHNSFAFIEMNLPGPHLHTWVCHGMVRCTSLQHFLKDSREQRCTMQQIDTAPGWKPMHICLLSCKKWKPHREDKQLSDHYGTYAPSSWGGHVSGLSVYSFIYNFRYIQRETERLLFLILNYIHLVPGTECLLLKSCRSLCLRWWCCTWTQSLVSSTQSGVFKLLHRKGQLSIALEVSQICSTGQNSPRSIFAINTISPVRFVLVWLRCASPLHIFKSQCSQGYSHLTIANIPQLVLLYTLKFKLFLAHNPIEFKKARRITNHSVYL